MKYLIVFSLIFISYITHAQQQLSLLDCVNIAIENSLAISQAELELMGSEIDYKQSKLEYLPNLNGSTTAGLGFGRNLDFTSYTFNTQTTQTSSFGLQSNTTLYNGGRIRENVKLQSLLVDRSETNIKKAKDDIAITVANNFLQAITAREQIGVAETQVNLRELDLERTQKLIDAGVSAGSVRVDMEAQLANAEFQRRQAENSYELALLYLKQTMLLDPSEKIELIEPEIAFPSYQYLQEQLNPSVVLAGALKTQGAILVANQDINIAESNKRIAQSQKMPTLSFGAGVNSYYSNQARDLIDTEVNLIPVPVEGLPPGENAYISFPSTNQIYADNYPLFNQFGDNMTQSLSLNLSIPIFNNGAIDQQIQRADLNIEQARISQKLQEQQLQQAIQQAYMEADLSYRSFEASQIQVESLEKAAEFAKKRYDLGTASIYDLFTTQNNLANAQIQLTQAKYDYLFKIKVLEFYKENQFELTK